MRATLLLAAGSSRRFGRGDKLLATLHGRPLIAHAIENALSSGAGRLIVVIPSRGGRLGRRIAAITRGRCAIVVARDHERGMGSSLAAGLAALRPIEREVLVFLGDMPFAFAPRRLRLCPGLEAARPMVEGVPGHPMLVRRDVAARVRPLGERGLASSSIRVGSIAGGAGHRIDIDTPAALARARRRGSSRRR